MKILLMEDDTVLADILVDFLQENDEVQHTYSMKKALLLSEKNNYDLYIFDINVADGDGISLLKNLRSFKDETPTIFITAFQDTKYLKNAFEAGADDFIKKPFELEELAQRIEKIKRHFGLLTLVQLAKDITLDTQTHTITTQDKHMVLSARHSECLHYLYKNRHRVVSGDELLQTFWQYEDMPSDNAIRTMLKELRKCIGKEHLINVRGEGYRFE